MLCENCGEEATRGAFFCGGCGRPLGFTREGGADSVETAGLDDVPPPEKSREDGPVAVASAKALCSRCMGAYQESELATVDGQRLCGDCNTLTASRSMRSAPATEADEIAPPRTVQIPHELPTAPPGGYQRMVVILVLFVAVCGIVAAVALPGSDRIDRILSGARDTGAGIRLAQTYVPGESFEYGMVMRTKMVMNAGNGMPFGEDLEGDFEMELGGLIRIDVLSSDTAGNGRVHLSFADFDAVLRGKVDGQQVEQSSAQLLPDISDSSVVMTIDPYGKLIGKAETDGPDLAGMVDMRQLFGEGLDGAPRGELRIGDVWKSRTSVPLGSNGSQKAEVEAEYEVLGHKHFKGHECVVISVEGSLSGNQVQGVEVDADMKGAMLIDARTGCLVKSAMDAEISVTGSSPAGNLDLEMEMSIDIDLR